MPSDILKQHPEIVLAPSATLREAMAGMTNSRIGIVLVVDAERRLAGLVSDIDLRRCLLQGGTLETRLETFMNKEPVVIEDWLDQGAIAEFFRRHPKPHIPVVGKGRRLVGLAEMDSFATIPPHYPNWVVIMAGGLGQRLGPLTKDTPKPMLPLGDKPILEVLIEQFKASGFNRFMFAVNYLADRIEAHFNDGAALGVQIEYLRENKPLGTVGALGLIKNPISEPLLVANGDILTKVNFKALLDFHKNAGALATLCVKSHDTQVPYGVIKIDGDHLQSFVEKPTTRTYINAGIYVLEPEIMSWIPRDQRFDMPQLVAEIQRRRSKGVACFPIQEYWMDIGEIQTYRRAEADYNQLFE